MVSEQTAIGECLVEAGLERPRGCLPYELIRLARLRPSEPRKENPRGSLRGDIDSLQQINAVARSFQASLSKPDPE